MLLSFSVQNFRSFRDEQTLSLLASKRLGPAGASECVAIPNTEEQALRVAALYGANGAGKSNLIRALRLVEQLVLKGTPPGKPLPYHPFLLDNRTATKPTSLELQFARDGRVFRYGLSYDSSRIHDEWLSVYEGTKERGLFSRVSEDRAVTVKLGSAAKRARSTKIKALAEVGARPNQLFLTEVVNLGDREAQGPLFESVVEWFTSTLAVIEADAQFMSLAEMIATDAEFAKFAGRFLQEASTGIADLKVERKKLPRSKAPPELLKALSDLSLTDSVAVVGIPGNQVIVDGTEKETIHLHRIAAMHEQVKGPPIPFPLEEESDGSRRLLHLLPALYRLTDRGGVFVIDELERSMHPMLARKFIEFFRRSVAGPESQLIFTTHESTLLDLELLRRDAIWFTEKDQEGATHLYSLADFKVRKDLQIEKGYLEGRFGAIPFLGGIDRLIEEQVAAETNA